MVDAERIVGAIAQAHGLRVSDIKGKDRHRSIARARHIAVYVLRKRFNFSYPELGTLFGHRDHTSVMHACRKVGADAELRTAAERWLGPEVEEFPGPVKVPVKACSSDAVMLVEGHRVA